MQYFTGSQWSSFKSGVFRGEPRGVVLDLFHARDLKQVAVGMKKCVFRLTLKAGREVGALRSAGSEFQIVGAM